MTTARRVLLSLSLLAFTGAAAYATSDARFSKLDRDGDGFIGHDDAAADADANSRFHALDKNKDLKISREEYGRGNDAAALSSAGGTDSAVPSDGGAFSTATPTTGKTATDPNLKYR